MEPDRAVNAAVAPAVAASSAYPQPDPESVGRVARTVLPDVEDGAAQDAVGGEQFDHLPGPPSASKELISKWPAGRSYPIFRACQASSATS